MLNINNPTSPDNPSKKKPFYEQVGQTDTVTERGVKKYREMLFSDVKNEGDFKKILEGGLLDVGSGIGQFIAELQYKYPEFSDKIFGVDVHKNKNEMHKERIANWSVIKFNDWDFKRRGELKNDAYFNSLNEIEKINYIKRSYEKEREAGSEMKNYVASYAQNLPFKDESFGQVVSNIGPLHYIQGAHSEENIEIENLKTSRSAIAILKEMIRVTKPGGQIRITPMWYGLEKLIKNKDIHLSELTSLPDMFNDSVWPILKDYMEAVPSPDSSQDHFLLIKKPIDEKENQIIINSINEKIESFSKIIDKNNLIDGITAKKPEKKSSEYFDYNKENYSIEKGLEEFGIDKNSLRPEKNKEREFSQETLELYSLLKNIVLNEWEDFKNELKNNEKLSKQVLGYKDEAEAFSDLEIRQEGLLSSDALKCFEDEVRTKIFFETINKKIEKDDEVLEAGTGTGIMAIAAARAGARKITALEINKTTAGFARRVIDRCVKEGIIRDKQIEIIEGDALKFSPDRIKKFDAFISENIYTGQFHELQMQIGNHLNQFIDVNQGKIIPRAMINGIELSSLSEKLKLEVGDRSDFTLKDYKNEYSTVEALSDPNAYDIIDFSQQAEIGLRNRFVKTVAEDGKIDSVTIFSLVQMSGDKGDFIGRNETEFLNDDMVVILVPPLEVQKGDIVEISISYKAADKPDQADIRVINKRTGKTVANRKNLQ